MKFKLVIWASVLTLLICVFPWIFVHLGDWQKMFNQAISKHLHEIKAHSYLAGLWLIFAAFIYGVLHALGPGHGKFILASYLATHESQFKTSVRLSLLASLTQGLVGIVATSIVVVLLNLSSQYFKLSQLWLERSAFILLLLLGLYWLFQGAQKYRKQGKLKIISISPLSKEHYWLLVKPQINQQICGCGHRHLPDNRQLENAQSWKSQGLVLLSIGMRPCSGAIFVLFFAYMLDLYLWGVAATLAMSLGTGLMLAGFATLVRYARNSASQLGKWYGGKHSRGDALVKCIAGGIMIFFALSLLYGSSLQASGGASLFGIN